MKNPDLPTRVRRLLWHYHPSAFLLAAQFVLLMLYATFEGIQTQGTIISAFGVGILALVVWVINRSPSVRWITWALAIPALVLTLLSALINDRLLLIWSAVIESALYFYAAGSLINYMMRDERVTMDELYAAGSTFTLLAWAFAYLYLVCQTWLLGSFASTTHPGQTMTFLELLFLSFSNLSATGLTDIYPMNSTARVLIMLEQFAGVGYVAMVVSRLIGMTIRNKPSRPRQEKENPGDRS